MIVRYLILALVVAMLNACATTQNISEPDWVKTSPKEPTNSKVFIGVGYPNKFEKDARDSATQDAFEQFLRYCGTEISIYAKYVNQYKSSNKKVKDTYNSSTNMSYLIEAFVSKVHSNEFFTKQGINNQQQNEYRTKVRLVISNRIINNLIAYQKNKQQTKINLVLQKYNETIKKPFTKYKDLVNKGEINRAKPLINEIHKSYQSIIKEEDFHLAQPSILNKGWLYPVTEEMLLHYLEEGVSISVNPKTIQVSNSENKLRVSVSRKGKPLINTEVKIYSGLKSKALKSVTNKLGLATVYLPSPLNQSGQYSLNISIANLITVSNTIEVKNNPKITNTKEGLDWFTGRVIAHGKAKDKSHYDAMRKAELIALNNLSKRVGCVSIKSKSSLSSNNIEQYIKSMLTDVKYLPTKTKTINGIYQADATVQIPYLENKNINSQCLF